VEQVETGHLVLNALRQLIPVLGFLGTVVGLSLGMVQFPDITKTGGNIDALRLVLKDFAASLSVAFDTTLLALGYSVVVVLVSSILRQREESFVSEVDTKARRLINKLSPLTEPASETRSRDERLQEVLRGVEGALRLGLFDPLGRSIAAMQAEVSSAVAAFLEKLAANNTDYAIDMRAKYERDGNAIIAKLDELKEFLRQPPSYEIFVQPQSAKARAGEKEKH